MKEDYQKNVDSVAAGVRRFFEKSFNKVEVSISEKARAACKTGPLMVASTHRSHADYFLLGGLLNSYGTKHIRFAAGDNLTNLPYIGPRFTGFGAFPVERARARDRSYIVQLSEEVASMLLDRQSILVFPEGGRSYKGNMMNINQVVIGGSILAQSRDRSAPVTIVPCAISYEKLPELTYFDTLEKGRQLRRSGKNPFQSLLGNTLYFGADAWAFVKFLNAHRFGGKYGDLYADFGDPFTISDCTDIDAGKKKDAPDNFWAYRKPARDLANEIYGRFLSLYRLLPEHAVAASLEGRETVHATEAKAQIQSFLELADSNGRNVKSLIDLSADEILEKGIDQLRSRKLIAVNGSTIGVRSRSLIDYYAAAFK